MVWSLHSLKLAASSHLPGCAVAPKRKTDRLQPSIFQGTFAVSFREDTFLGFGNLELNLIFCHDCILGGGRSDVPENRLKIGHLPKKGIACSKHWLLLLVSGRVHFLFDHNLPNSSTGGKCRSIKEEMWEWWESTLSSYMNAAMGFCL